MITVETKERILETALELFAQNGYLGIHEHDRGAVGNHKGRVI